MKQTLKVVGSACMIVGVIVGIVGLSEMRDKRAMAVHYCWDSHGDHYVAPNASCAL